MVKTVWFFLISIGIIYAFLTGNVSSINLEIISSAESSLNIILKMLPIIVLWMGLLKIAEDSGLVAKFSKLIAPVILSIFPSLKKNDKALGYVASNIVANAIGLGSAATPFGLKAMEEMQKDNLKKDTATDAMVTFLVINTTGFTIIPTTVIALRMAHNSVNPSIIILASILSAIITCVLALFIDYLIRRGR